MATVEPVIAGGGMATREPVIADDVLQPGEFCGQLLRALDASEGRSKRRKRDQTPDTIGMGMKRELLERAAEQNPPVGEFEGWLVEQVISHSASGGARAMAGEILAEYRTALADPAFRAWLAAGAPSADGEDAEAVPVEFIGKTRRNNQRREREG
jgi:hypothetical protein